jgi:hypothetical protein
MLTHQDFEDITGGEFHLISGSIDGGVYVVEHTLKYKDFRQRVYTSRLEGVTIDQWISDNIKRFLKELINNKG